MRKTITRLLIVLLLLCSLGLTWHVQGVAPAPAPTIVVLVTAGPGATASLEPGSTDQAGQFTITTGSYLDQPAALVELHFGTTHTVIAIVLAADAATAVALHQEGPAWVTPAAGYVTVGLAVPGNRTYTFTYLTRSL